MKLPTLPCPAAKCLLLCGLLTPAFAMAQSPSKDADTGEVFWLSPFEVVSETGTGYERTSAGTATRISMDILETPLSIQVISEEFMKDTGRTDLVDIFDYSASIDTSPDNTLRNDQIKVRGFGVSFVLRDGFKKYYDAPLDAVDRVEVVKGPNAVFFGQSQPGGVINYVTKSPLWDRYNELRVEYGDNNHFKALADSTGPINDLFAYRIITSYRDSDSWKWNTSWENKYVFAALTMRSLDKVEITGKYEYHTGFQTGGVNTALVGNDDYFRDYYVNEGRDYGYAVDWDNAAATGIAVTIDPGTTTAVGVRYPWPVAPGSAAQRYVQPPVTGTGGINPRWDGTITPALQQFFGGSVPQAFLDWAQPDQSVFPAYQRNVKLPFQYNTIDLFSTGTGAGYKPGWRVLKWFANGMQDYPNRFTGPIFPNGYNWNANGVGSFHDTEHHIATLEAKAELFAGLNLRYAANYLENTYLRLQQHNSDPDMDGATLDPAQGYLIPSSTSSPSALYQMTGSASRDMFDNKRWTHQLDLTKDFEIGGTRHTLLVSAELRKDRFTSYDVDRTDYYLGNVLRPLRLNVDGSVRNYTFQEGLANWDIFTEQPDNLAMWADLSNPRPNTSSGALVEKAFSGSYKGTFLKERLSVLTGIRHEQRMDFSYDGTTIGGQVGETLAANTPMVGLNYELAQGLTVYASYSESFVPPGRPQGRNTVTFYEGPVANPTTTTEAVGQLGPEKGIGYEGGFKASGLKGKLSGIVTAFHLERQNIVVSDSNLIESLRLNYQEYNIPWDSTLESGSAALRKNSGVEVSEGIETDILYQPTTNWSINASFTWLWKAELENPDPLDFYGDVNQPVGSNAGPYPHPSLFSDQALGTYTIPSSGQVVEILRPLSVQELNNAISAAAAAGTAPVNPYTGDPLVFEPIQHADLAGVSKLRAALWTRYKFSEGRLEGLSLCAGGNYQSRQRPQQDRDLDYWNGGFWIFDTMASYDIPFDNGTSLTLQLNVNNILDRRAIDSGGFGINAPRTWKLTATYKF